MNETKRNFLKKKVCPHTVTIAVIHTLHINSKLLLASLHTHTARGRAYTTNINSYTI